MIWVNVVKSLLYIDHKFTIAHDMRAIDDQNCRDGKIVNFIARSLAIDGMKEPDVANAIANEMKTNHPTHTHFAFHALTPGVIWYGSF